MDAEAEVQYSGHLMGRADSLEKSLGKYFPKAGKAWRQKMGVTEDEMVR